MRPPNEEPVGRSLALIIATSSYSDPTLTRLRAPGRDARDLAQVLDDKTIGGYDVETVLDATADTIRRRVAQFCARGGPHDLALLYLSCHGVLDERGQLHYAATDTERALIAATAVEASWLNRQLEDCRCRRQVLILDCCHSGAFAHGARGQAELALPERFPEAQGRAVLTASRATEYAFEGDHIDGEGASAVFTGALVDGLRSGDADRDGDGLISVTELFDYAYDIVVAHGGPQRPGLWVHRGEGKLIVARNPRGPRINQEPLPDYLVAALESAVPAVRIGAVSKLKDVLEGPSPGRALTAREYLERMAAEDIPSVAKAARDVLELHHIPREPPEVALPLSPPPEDAPRSPPQPPAVESSLPLPPPEDRPSSPPRTPMLPWLRWSVLAAIALALVAVIALFVVLGGDSPGTVKVGAIYSLSGTGAGAGREARDGAQFAVDYINHGHDSKSTLPLAAGGGLPGLDGAKLKLVVANARSDRCQGQPAFKRLVAHDHVAAVVGAYESTVTLQALIAANKRHVPLVNDSATAPPLTERTGGSITACHRTELDPRPSPWFFRVGPSDTQATEQFFQFIEQAEVDGTISHVRKVAILHENNDIFGNTGTAATKRIAKNRKITIEDLTYRTVLGPSEPLSASACAVKQPELIRQLRSRVEQIKAYRPDVVFALGYLPDAIAMVQMMQKLGYVPRALFAYGAGFVDGAFISSVRAGTLACKLPAADPAGIIARVAWSPDLGNASATARRVADLFQQHYKRPMTPTAASAFTATLTLAQAINKAGSTDPERIQAALRALDVSADETIMPWAGIKFDDHGQNLRAQVVLQQIRGNGYRVVYPPGWATARAIWPLSKAR
jgi:ABC-type branched-subunit amino acid transport system substrate-binding protein